MARGTGLGKPPLRARLGCSANACIDHGHENIRVKAICRLFVETDLTACGHEQSPDPDALQRQRIGAPIPISRLGQPEDIAGLAVYLASNESCWVRGAAFPVDGGYWQCKLLKPGK
jgi:NAD(P)-dependent dehydrogenase (short-subunit alcohol dehydrogenase family)